MGLRSRALSAGVKLRYNSYKRERHLASKLDVSSFFLKCVPFELAMFYFHEELEQLKSCILTNYLLEMDPCVVMGLTLFSKLLLELTRHPVAERGVM